MKVVKRNGISVNYDSEKVAKAVLMAIKEVKWPNKELSLLKRQAEMNQQAELVSTNVYKVIEALDIEEITTDQLQNIVETELEKENPEAGKRYIVYRNYRDQTRSKRKPYRLLSDDFISEYKKVELPMDQLGSFVYYRTYSRWIKEEQRREHWWETVRRAVEYNVGLDHTLSKEAAIAEAESLFKSIFGLNQFMSGRTFWVGNTDIAIKYPTANYNCAFTVAKTVKVFKEIFYLLMLGSGVGISVQKEYVNEMEQVRSNYELIHTHYTEVPSEERVDHTSMTFVNNTTVKIQVGDSKEGWANAIDIFFELITSTMYKKVKTIILNYNYVRPQGEELKTFGGTASGHESLLTMFDKIDNRIKAASARDNVSHFNLHPIDVADISNIIGENVVSGGVRRTSQMIIFDYDDMEMRDAKKYLYTEENGKWTLNKAITHRQMSNNSIMYFDKPSRESFHDNFVAMRYSGEPGWINGKEGKRRNPHMKGLNPCGEILLDSKGLCNLQTIVLSAFVDWIYDYMPSQDEMMTREDDYLFGATGALNLTRLMEAFGLAVRSSFRMTLADLELKEWDEQQKARRLLGISMTGIQDAFNAMSLDWIQKESLLFELTEYARKVADEYADKIGVNRSDLITTIKPEGTLSQLAGVSSGIHFSHSPYFIRRVRISANDALTKVAEELQWPVFPEVGQDLLTCTTKYVEFPCKAPEGRTKYDVSAIEQLEEYKLFMRTYVDHNASITVHVRQHEWEEVEQWVWDNWDSCVALSFLSLDDNYYEATPYEAITKEEYEERLSKMAPFVPSLITKYATSKESDIGVGECKNNICPLR